MKKLTSLEDTATITITGRDAVMLHTLLGRTRAQMDTGEALFDAVEGLLEKGRQLYQHKLEDICYLSVQAEQEAIAFPETKKDLMLKELQSKMDDLQNEIDKIKGEEF